MDSQKRHRTRTTFPTNLNNNNNIVVEKKKDNWIKKAIKHPGSLRAYVRRTYGDAGFTKSGNIKPSIISRLASHDDKIGRKARLAKTLKKL